MIDYSMMDTVRCLSQVPYRFAKTMPNDPHYYTFRRDWNALEGFTPEVFPGLVTEMRQRETRRVYVSPSGYRRQQRYLDANGYQWWTMGAAVEETILINRAPKWYPDVECYDRVAHAYDDAYRDPGEKRISEQWFTGFICPVAHGCWTLVAAQGHSWTTATRRSTRGSTWASTPPWACWACLPASTRSTEIA